MIRQVVLMKLKEEAEHATSEHNGRLIQEGMKRLEGVIEGLDSVQVWLGLEFDRKYNVCIVNDFVSREAMEAYGAHPDHQEMRTFIHKVVEDDRPAFNCIL